MKTQPTVTEAKLRVLTDEERRKALTPRPERMHLIFALPEMRPPVYDEMVEDMSHIIKGAVASYVDLSCVELHFEDLVADCWAKTTQMISRGLIKRCANRVVFFKQYKTAIMNHLYSLVQKHRFTEKRTGVKPPPKSQRNVFTGVSTKPQEVRIDDPESGFQISDIVHDSDQMEFKDLMEHVNAKLGPTQQLVLQELVEPSMTTLEAAKQDAERGRSDGEPLRIRIRNEHRAMALGMLPSEFQRHHDNIKVTCLFMKTNFEDDPRKIAALSTLLQYFGIQIPVNTNEMIRKRALLIASIQQYDNYKDDAAIKEAMRLCEIPLPEVRNDRFKCFGILFQKEHRTCRNCDKHDACQLKAANYGLGEITISNKLLGSRHPRVPSILPTRSVHDAALVESEREDEILAFLEGNFKPVKHKDEIGYAHIDRRPGIAGPQIIFSLGKSVSPLHLRFVNPAEELKPALTVDEKSGRRSWYLSEDTSTAEALNLIRAHAQLTYGIVYAKA